MSVFHLDYETFSEEDLRSHGVYKYASGPSTEILLCAICKDDGPVEIWDRYASHTNNAAALKLLREACVSGASIFAHNAYFEIAVSDTLWKSTFGFPPPELTQWRCTATMARIAGIPSSLEKAAEFLKLGEQKDKTGAALIRTFSIPDTKTKKRRLPTDEGTFTLSGVKTSYADAWRKFRDYCIKDVEVERAIHAKLKSLELEGFLLDAFQLDLRMNRTGIPVNIPAIIEAEKIVDAFNEVTGARFRAITGYNAGQTAKVLAWLKERGYPGDDLRAGTVSGQLDDEETAEADCDTSGMKPEAVEALRLRSLLSFAALKKLPTMREAACPDSKVRGALLFYGASRTGRHSGKIIQIQNFRRPTIDNTDACYDLIRSGVADHELLELAYGSPLEAIASCIRHFIHPEDGQFLDIDLAQIEARVVAWLSGHDELLQSFRDGKDLYKTTAFLVFGVPYDEVDKELRFLGKTLALACVSENQLVLTDKGLLPICEVSCCHRVWDGEEWVNHEGVIFKGYREVIEWDGLTATPDHVVFVGEEETMSLSEAKHTQRSLHRSLPGRAYVWEVGADRHQPLPLQKPGTLGGQVSVWSRRPDLLGESDIRENARVQCVLTGCAKDSAQVADEEVVSGQRQMHQSQQSHVAPIWGERSDFSLGNRRGRGKMDHGESTSDSCKADRQEGQQQRLSAREPAMVNICAEQQKQGWVHDADRLHVRSEGMAILRGKSAPVYVGRHDAGRDTRQSGDRSEGEAKRVEVNEEMVRPIRQRKSVHLPPSCICAVPSGPVALLGGHGQELLCARHDPQGDHRTSGQNSGEQGGEIQGYPRVVRTERVYDIMNAGPRNRFTVSGVVVHNCNYAGGYRAFATMAKNFGTEVPKKKAKEVVKLYRAANKPITSFWAGMQNGAVEAITNPGKWVSVNDKIRIGCHRRLGYLNMVIELPSGRCLNYPLPEVNTVYKIGRRKLDENGEEDTEWEPIPTWKALNADGTVREGVWATSEISYHGPITQAMWGRVRSSGGVLVENVSQATAADFLTHGVLAAEKAGYEPAFVVHDQLICNHHPERGNTMEDLTEVFCSLPPWAPGFPLEAAGAITNYYTK